LRRLLAIFLPLLVLWAIVALLDHYLAVWTIYLWLGGMFVTVGALQFPRRLGLTAALFAGLLCDANAPVTFGCHALLFGLATVILQHLRPRLDRHDPIIQWLVALATNASLFLVFTAILLHHLPGAGRLFSRFAWDLLFSELAVLALAPWFFALQRHALEFADPVAAMEDRRQLD